MCEKTENRDCLIYELITERYRLQWQRTTAFDQKASNIIGFVGIILSLQVGMVIYLLGEIERDCKLFLPISIVILLIIIFLIFSILCSLKAYQIKKWEIVPDTEYLIEEYAIKDRKRLDVLRILSAEISVAIKHNEELNAEKAKFIRYSLQFFVLGVGMIAIFLCSLLLI